ncbi:MAG: tyrosine-type recombinase/integrase [Chloroflexota bacterium]
MIKIDGVPRPGHAAMTKRPFPAVKSNVGYQITFEVVSMAIDWLKQATAQIPLSHIPDLAAPNASGIIDISADTRRQFGVAVRSLIRFLGDVELTAVSPIDIHRWQCELAAGDSCRPVTINSYLRTLRTIYGRLQRNGIVAINPAAAVPYLQENQRQAKAISRGSYEKLLAAADLSRDRAVVATLWATGCRLSELIGMDADAGRFELWQEDGERRFAVHVVGKGAKPRWVYGRGREASLLAEWIKQRPGIDGPLFTTRHNGRFTRNGMSALLKRLRQAAGDPPRCNAHAFRHGFAIRQLNGGYDLATVSAWLGHSSPEFTAAVYAVRTEDELRARYFEEP